MTGYQISGISRIFYGNRLFFYFEQKKLKKMKNLLTIPSTCVIIIMSTNKSLKKLGGLENERHCKNNYRRR